VSELQTIICETETVISGEHQNPANQRVPDRSQEIIISVPQAIICTSETIVCVLQIGISKLKTIISKRISVIDGPHTIISGPDSIMDVREAIMSVVETIISTTEIDFSKADTNISAFPASVVSVVIIVSAAEQTAGAVLAFGSKARGRRDGKFSPHTAFAIKSAGQRDQNRVRRAPFICDLQRKWNRILH